MRRSYDHQLKTRLDFRFFDVPEECQFEEELKENYNKDSLLFLTRLYIDSYRLLSHVEYSAVQALLIVQQVWDERPEAPVQEQSGTYFRTFEPVPLTFDLVAKILKTDKLKLMISLKSALKSLPMLSSLVNPNLLADLKSQDIPILNKLEPYSLENLRSIGATIRQEVIRRKGEYHAKEETNQN